MWEAGKLQCVAGLLLAATGLAVMAFGQMPFLGRLPGDLVCQRRNVIVYVPLATCIIISLVATAVIRFLGR